MAIDFAKLRRLEAALETSEALHDGLRRAYYGYSEGQRFVPGLRDDAQAARVDLLARVSSAKAARRHAGGPTFDFGPDTTVAEMLTVFEAESARLRAVPATPDAPLSTLRADIASARAAQELDDRAEAMRRSMEERNAAAQPLRQLVAACREYTGHARSTLAHFAA